MKLTSKILIALTVFGTSILTAQNAAKWVPENAFVVAGLKLDRIKADLLISKTSEREFYQTFIDKFTRKSRRKEETMLVDILENPQSISANILQGAAGFVAQKDSLTIGGCFFGITSTEKISHLVDSVTQKIKSPIKAVRSDNFNYVISKNLIFAWNKNKFFIGNGMISHTNNYNNVWIGETDNKAERELQAQDYLEKAALYIDETFQGSTSITKTANFKAHSVTKKDAWIWADYSAMMNTYFQVMSRSGFGMRTSQLSMMNSLRSIYDNLVYAVGFNFNASNIVLDVEMQQGEKLRELTSKIYDRKLNKKFFKYLPKNTVGFMSIAINVEESINGMFELYKPFFETVPMYGQKAKTAIELIQLALDENGLGSILQGDMLFACHDASVVDKEVRDYVMDENYEYKDTMIIKRKMDPKFVLMATIGKEESFDIVLRGLLAVDAAEFNENQYNLKTPRYLRREIGDLTLVVHDGIAFFTNDIILVNKVILQGGYPKNQQMEKRIQKMARKSPSTVVFYPEMILKGMEETFKLDSAELLVLNSVKDMGSTVEITNSGLKKKMAKSKIVIKNTQGQTALGHVLDIMDAYDASRKIRRARWESSAETEVEPTIRIAAPVQEGTAAPADTEAEATEEAADEAEMIELIEVEEAIEVPEGE